MKVKITERDNGYKKILALLTNTNPQLKVGILGAKAEETHEGSDLSVAEIGAFHEFGLGNNPERSFLRAWAEENEDKAAAFLKAQVEALVKAKAPSMEPAIERLGIYCQTGIQARIASNIPPPLAQETIDRKGSSVALIDTGQLRSSITYQVGDGSSK